MTTDRLPNSTPIWRLLHPAGMESTMEAIQTFWKSLILFYQKDWAWLSTHLILATLTQDVLDFLPPAVGTSLSSCDITLSLSNPPTPLLPPGDQTVDPTQPSVSNPFSSPTPWSQQSTCSCRTQLVLSTWQLKLENNNWKNLQADPRKGKEPSLLETQKLLPVLMMWRYHQHQRNRRQWKI
jgi:hypothetical protein